MKVGDVVHEHVVLDVSPEVFAENVEMTVLCLDGSTVMAVVSPSNLVCYRCGWVDLGKEKKVQQ